MPARQSTFVRGSRRALDVIKRGPHTLVPVPTTRPSRYNTSLPKE